MSQETATVQAFTSTESVINYNLDPRFASLIGDTPVNAEETLDTLSDLESDLRSGDRGPCSYNTILAVTRMRLMLASTFFGPESPQVQKVLQDMCFNFYMASKDEATNQWEQVLTCFEMLAQGNFKAKGLCIDYVEEAREHLAQDS
jgi:hypothetical protein